MPARGVRGATTVANNTTEEILAATADLLQEMVAANDIDTADIASVLFTLTADLDAAFPAKAARDMGWSQVPLINAREIPVPGSLERCIRVLIHWNTAKGQADIQHVYRNDAVRLRPDLQGQRSHEEVAR